MHSTAEQLVTPGQVDGTRRRLFVAWQNPRTRTIAPVGCLARAGENGDRQYEFRYLQRALSMTDFHPFVSFPNLRHAYRSPHLFPFFANRLMPRAREDYPDYLSTLALNVGADPFEVLGRSGGRRATDAIEVFPEPVVDPATRAAACHFLVRGVRHLDHAQEAIDGLVAGDHLQVLPDPQNSHDPLALLLRTATYGLVGFVPAFLNSIVHRLTGTRSWRDVSVEVVHIADRLGPVHLRLLCRLRLSWPFDDLPFSGPEFALVEPI